MEFDYHSISDLTLMNILNNSQLTQNEYLKI